MTIDVKRSGTALTIRADGKLDTQTAPELEAAIQENSVGVTKLTFDFRDLIFVSSTGLRVLLKAQKIMDRQGEMEFLPLQEQVRDVFAMTGLLDIFTVLD